MKLQDKKLSLLISLLTLIVAQWAAQGQELPLGPIPESTSMTVPPSVTAPQSPDIGVGLEGLADWSRAMMFSDAMKTSRRWGKVEAPWVHEVETDDKGWPLEDAGVVVIADTPGIGGTYKLSFTGKAEVSNVAHSAKVHNLHYDLPTNTTTADVVVPQTATSLMLAFRNSNGGFKNVSLLRPNSDSRGTFSAAFLDKIKPFSTLRFMDYLSTNNNPVKTWSERTTPAHSTQARPQGGALEYVVELANLSGKDIWINVPDQADDNYVRQMAQFLAARLKTGIKVYVEWSNEVWNWQFQQAQRNLQAARVEGKAAGSPLAFDNSNNEGYWGMRRIAQRSAEVGAVFRQVFSDKGFERVRPVYATQVGYEDVYKQGLALLEHRYGQPRQVFYGIAGAPYFQVPEELNKKRDLTIEEIFAAMPTDINRNLEFAKVLGSYAQYYGLKHLAYEGGQHLQDHGDVGNAEVKVAANRDPRMGEAIETYLRGWNALGGDLFMYFTLTSGYSKWGSWGLVEDVSSSSPKYEAVLRVLSSSRTSVTVGHGVPGSINSGDFIASNRWDKKGVEEVTIEPGKWMNYLLRADQAGRYTLSLQVSAVQKGSAQILVNAADSGIIRINAGAREAIATIMLGAGLNVVRVHGQDGRFTLKSLRIDSGPTKIR